MSKLDDPRHLRSLGGLPEPLARALREQAASGPSPEQTARLAAALGVTLPPPAGPASGAPPAAGAGASSAGALAKVGAPLALGVGLAGVIVVGAGLFFGRLSALPPSTTTTTVTSAPPPSASPVAPAPAPAVPAPTEVTETEPAEIEQEAPRARPSRRATSEPARAPATTPAETARALTTSEPADPTVPAEEDDAEQLRAENALIQRAETALAHDPSLALRLADEHRTRFPRGTLAEEREVIAIDALLRMHQRETAETRARAFTASHAGSVHSRRIERLLARP